MPFSHVEYTDIHLAYQICDGKATVGAEEYRQRYPRRRTADRYVLTVVHQHLREKGSYRVQTAVPNVGTTKYGGLDAQHIHAQCMKNFRPYECSTHDLQIVTNYSVADRTNFTRDGGNNTRNSDF